MNRVLTATRLQVVHPMVILGMPWLIAASSFALNWVLWAVTVVGEEPGAFTGGILALYITVSVVFVQAVTQLLPFAMGLSLSRRTYWLGVALFAAAVSAGSGVVLAVLSRIEQATGGWGVGLEFWAPGPLYADSFPVQVLTSGVPMLAFAFIGVAIGVVYKRWGTGGVWALTLATLVLSGALVVLLTWRNWWDELGAWLADRSLVALAVGLPAAVAVVVAALSYAGIRRVVP